MNVKMIMMNTISRMIKWHSNEIKINIIYMNTIHENDNSEYEDDNDEYE